MIPWKISRVQVLRKIVNLWVSIAHCNKFLKRPAWERKRWWTTVTKNPNPRKKRIQKIWMAKAFIVSVAWSYAEALERSTPKINRKQCRNLRQNLNQNLRQKQSIALLKKINRQRCFGLIKIKAVTASAIALLGDSDCSRQRRTTQNGEWADLGRSTFATDAPN